MKKIEILLLIVIAACSLILGVKLTSSLTHKLSDVSVIDLTNFDDFDKRQNSFIASNLSKNEEDQDVVFSNDKHVYLRAQQWEWYPTLELQSGREYRLHIASSDIQHSFHLESGATGQIIDVLIQPGKEYILSLKNLSEGVYAIGCTEYCGIQHNKMRGALIVR